MSYTAVRAPSGELLGVSLDGRLIPPDPGNRDWRAFLAWNAAQAGPIDLGVVPDLAALKAARLAQVAARTEELRAAGFAYGGHAFPADASSCTTWTGMLLGAQAGQLAYPVSVGTVDHQAAQLSSRQDVQAFYAAGTVRLSQILQGGVAVAAAVQAAADVAALAAVSDDRT